MKFDTFKFRKAVRGEITQTELAAKLGIKQDGVSRILKRGNQMKISQFESICEAINREPTEFYTEEEKPKMLKLDKTELNAAIVNNPANSEYQWSTHLCPETGTLVNLSSTEDGSRYETLIPVPSMDPEGSGEEGDRFDEFTTHPPADIKLIGLLSYQEFLDSDEIPKYEPERAGYIEYAQDSGWDSIETDWEQSEAEHLDFIRDEWIDGLKTGHLDSVNHLDVIDAIEIVLV